MELSVNVENLKMMITGSLTVHHECNLNQQFFVQQFLDQLFMDHLFSGSAISGSAISSSAIFGSVISGNKASFQRQKRSKIMITDSLMVQY